MMMMMMMMMMVVVVVVVVVIDETGAKVISLVYMLFEAIKASDFII
jgi:hypothetical protein